MEKNMKKNIYICVCVCMYNWTTLLYSRNEYNIVNQQYPNNIKFLKETKKVPPPFFFNK